MDRVLKVGDTITLVGESNPFQVLNCIEYDNQPYAHIYKIPNNIANILFPEILERTFVKEVVVDGHLQLEEVLDEEIKSKLLDMVSVDKK